MKNYSIKKSCIIILFAGLVMLAVLNIHSITQGVALVGNILMPFWIGIIMAFILNMLMVPINNFLAAKIFKKNKKPAKAISIVLSYLIFILIIVALLAFVIPELTNSIATFIGNWGTYIEELQDMINDITLKYDIDAVNLNKLTESLTANIEKFANQALAYIGNMVPHVVAFMSNIVGFLFNIIMAVVISANILVYKEKLMSQISRTTKAYLPKFYDWLSKLAVVTADTFRRYVSGQFIEALILGGLCYIGMMIFRFDYALLISTVIAVTALIPVAGAYIGGAVAVILLAIISPIKAIMFLVYLVILQQIETNLIYPRVVGSSLELPGIWVIFAVTVGGGAFGILGILFAVPVMSVAYKFIREAVVNREGKDAKDRNNKDNTPPKLSDKADEEACDTADEQKIEQ